jgi:hypothetical protein
MIRTVCLCVGLLLATGSAAEESRSDLFSQQPGRYQIVISPQIAKSTFLVDTANGRVWQLTTITDVNDSPSVWLFMPRIDDDPALTQFAREHGLKKDAPAFLGSAPVRPQSPMKLNSN